MIERGDLGGLKPGNAAEQHLENLERPHNVVARRTFGQPEQHFLKPTLADTDENVVHEVLNDRVEGLAMTGNDR